MKQNEKFSLNKEDLYRNQFVLAPRPVPLVASWYQQKICRDLYLATRPPLIATCVSHDEKSLVLLGYILDPESPKSDDITILKKLLTNFDECRKLPKETENYCGRWILIADDGGSRHLFHDAAGTRQVTYAIETDTHDVWCASQADLLASVLSRTLTAASAKFIKSTEFHFMSGGHWWPGDGSPFAGIKRLLPNHSLDLCSGESTRYWPDGLSTQRTVEQGAVESAEILRATMQAAANRFPLTLLITAGKDSRTLLAAGRQVCNSLHFASIGSNAPDDSETAVPAMLLSRLGLSHQIGDPKGKPRRRFWKYYRRNSPLANKSYAAAAEAIAPLLAQRRVAVTGHVSEVAKSFYTWRTKDRVQVTPQELARLTGMGQNCFAVTAFAEWLSGARDQKGVGLLDLFYWEQRAGSWLPMWLQEYDLIWRDCVIPFNCRTLLTTMLSVPEKHRWPKVYDLYDQIILELWPELIDHPFGTVPRQSQRIRQAWKSRVHQLHKRVYTFRNG